MNDNWHTDLWNMSVAESRSEQTSPFSCKHCGHWMEYLSDGIYMCQNDECIDPDCIDDDPER